MKYSPILVLKIKHSFYADGRCPDFAIEASAETENLLNNHRCVLKTSPDAVRILRALDDAGKPFLPLPKDATFLLRLVLQNRDFALFTDLAGIDQQLAPLFTNVDSSGEAGGELELRSRSARYSESFIVSRPAAKDRFTLGGRPLEGLDPPGFEIKTKAAIAAVAGYDPAAKEILLSTEAASAGDSFTVSYPVRPRLPRGVFADVEVRLDGGGDRAEPSEFHVAFRAKRARWTYYCVTDLAKNGNAGSRELTIGDKAEEPLLFSDSNRRELGEEPDPEDRIALQLADRYPKLRRVRFISDELIACRQTPRKHVELRLDGERVSGPLPNPPLRNYSSVEIPLPNSRLEQDSLFQVVKYLTQPFPT